MTTRPCCGLRHLTHQVGRHEHRVPVRGQILEHGSHPADALRVQAVDRLVQHHGLRVAQQRRGHPEPLTHAEGEPADPLAGDLSQADDVDHLVDPPRGDAVGLGQGEQVVARRPAGVHRLGLEQHTRARPSARRRTGNPPPLTVTRPAVGLSSPAIIRIVVDFPAPFGPRKPVTIPGCTDEAQPVDREFVAVTLAEILDFDHGICLSVTVELRWSAAAFSEAIAAVMGVGRKPLTTR